MRALIVAPYLPTPGSGGRTRLVNLVGRMAGRHDLRVVAFLGEGQQPSDLTYDGRAVPMPPLPDRRRGPVAAARWYAGRAVATLPTYATYVRSAAMHEAVAAECEAFRPDLVMINTSEMAQYLASIPPGPARVLDLQDVSSRWVGRAVGRATSRRDRLLLAQDARVTRRYEARAAALPEVVLVTSAIERAFLLRLAGVDAYEIPNGVDTTAFIPPAVRPPEGIVFVGPLTSTANMQALRWFCAEVLPLLRARVGPVAIDVVGTPAGDGWPEEVRLVGRVDDVRVPMAEAALNIVPIRVGSGTRYKILEALSMEQAVVSTRVGAEGLDVVDGTHLRLADEPGAFADAMAGLLGAPELRASLGRAGREHVRALFDWAGIVERLEVAWEAAVRGRPGAA